MSSVSNIKDGFQIAMDLANAANRAGDVAQLIDTQQQVLAVLDENRNLRARVEELEADLAAVSQLERQGLDYFVREEDGSLTGPVCPTCYTKDHIVSLLASQPGYIKFCARCKQTYFMQR
jgi:hypothetical protein